MCLSPQDPFNKVVYELIGDETAPSFFLLEDSNIKVRENVDLAADSETTYIVSLILQ